MFAGTANTRCTFKIKACKFNTLRFLIGVKIFLYFRINLVLSFNFQESEYHYLTVAVFLDCSYTFTFLALLPLSSLNSSFLCFLQKLIPELQKLFVAKNETNVLKLWPLFVKLLGKVELDLEYLSQFSQSTVASIYADDALLFSPNSCCTKEVHL